MQDSSVSTTAPSPESAASVQNNADAQADQRFALKLLAGGRALFAQGDRTDALTSFEETLRLYPESGLAHLEWAIAAQYVGEDPVTIAPHLAKAVALMPGNPRARYQEALFQEAYGDRQKSIASYRRVLKMRQDHDDARVRLAGLLMAQRPLSKSAKEETLALYQTVVRRDPTRVDAQLGLAKAAEANGVLKIAEQAMRQMIALKPKVSAHRQRLIAFYKRTDQPQKARQAKRDLDRVDPKAKRRLRRLRRSKGR